MLQTYFTGQKHEEKSKQPKRITGKGFLPAVFPVETQVSVLQLTHRGWRAAPRPSCTQPG